MRPLIGIPTRTRITGSGVPADELRRAYAQAVADAGGRPVLLPLVDGEAPMLDGLDGVLLAGGCDVDPLHYGEPPHPRLGEIDPPRDRHELELARACLDRRRPVLGLCRGHQVLAVASGGALWQDLPSQVAPATSHAQTLVDAHPVTLSPGSRLATILACQRLHVNSRHHQAAKTLGSGWAATGHSDDGVVEGIELADHPFAIGVQWHPEDLTTRAEHRRLFSALIAAATR